MTIRLDYPGLVAIKNGETRPTEDEINEALAAREECEREMMDALRAEYYDAGFRDGLAQGRSEGVKIGYECARNDSLLG